MITTFVLNYITQDAINQLFSIELRNDVMRKFLLLLFCSMFCFVHGCASVYSNTRNGKFISMTAVQENIKINKTTYTDVRKLLGTPFFITTIAKKNKLLAYIYVSSAWKNTRDNFCRAIISAGLASQDLPVVLKDVYVVLNEDNTVKDLKINGYSFILRKRFLIWVEAFRKLNKKELYSTIDYEVNDCYQHYFEDLAALYEKPISEVPEDEKEKEFAYQPIQKLCYDGAVEFYGLLPMPQKRPDQIKVDAEKIDLIYR